jgi:hypothetical protein
VNGDVTFTAQWSGGTSGQRWDEGVYIGLISFAGTSTDLTNGVPIRPDNNGKNSLNSKLNSDYVISSENGTALIYGVHQALANLKASDTNYPANLDSVNVITFTDGQDRGSTGILLDTPIEDQAFDTTSEYAQYVQGQIANRNIAGKSITAYSIGVLGEAGTSAGFQGTLDAIASPGKAYQLDSFDDVLDKFEEIASALNVTHTSAQFTMSTNLEDPGTKVRITFDDVQPSSNLDTDTTAVNGSAQWIEGKVTRTTASGTTTYTLTEIAYNGISSDATAGTSITGTRVGTSNVNFVFNNVTGLPDNLQQSDTRVRQWTQPTGVSTWEHNEEYSMGNDVSSTVERRSSIIYLALDSSTSLNITQIGQIRQAAISFINLLYNQINQ